MGTKSEKARPGNESFEEKECNEQASSSSSVSPIPPVVPESNKVPSVRRLMLKLSTVLSSVRTRVGTNSEKACPTNESFEDKECNDQASSLTSVSPVPQASPKTAVFSPPSSLLPPSTNDEALSSRLKRVESRADFAPVLSPFSTVTRSNATYISRAELVKRALKEPVGTTEKETAEDSFWRTMGLGFLIP